MIKDKVLEILYQLGFQPELVDENFGYRFEYEGLTVLFTPEDEDAHRILHDPGNLRHIGRQSPSSVGSDGETRRKDEVCAAGDNF